MLTTVVLVLCFLCSPGNIVSTEERIWGATVYSAGFVQFSKSYYRENCVLSLMYHNIICLIPSCTIERNAPTFPRAPFFYTSPQPPRELRKMFSSPASVPLDNLFPSIYTVFVIIFLSPGGKRLIIILHIFS